MTEARVRALFVSYWTSVPSDEVIVATQRAICQEVLVEITCQTKVDLNEAGAEMFLKMVAVICRLSHFHSLREGAANNVPPSYWEHLGFVMVGYKDAASYCYSNYDRIAHFDFINGKPKEEIEKFVEQVQKRDAEVMAEAHKNQRVTFADGEFRAMHELFCFVIQTILSPEVFTRYTKGVNEAFAFLRKQQALLNLPRSTDPKPS